MDTERLDKLKKWLDAHGAIYQRHADFLKLSMAGVLEYGKIIAQSLFVINGTGIVAVQFLFINLNSDPIKKYSLAYLWACGFFLAGFALTLLMCLFMYKNFSSLYKDGVAEYADEVRLTHRAIFGNKDELDFDLKSIRSEVDFSYKMAHLTAWFSVVSFCAGCFVLVLKIVDII